MRITDGCWEWKLSKDKGGYGYFHCDGKQWYAHRFIMEQMYGPSDLSVEHLCGNPSCVKPTHLTYMPIGDNILAGKTNMGAVNSKKTHCPKGHEYTATNSKPNHNGKMCRLCFNETARIKYKLKRSTNSSPLSPT